MPTLAGVDTAGVAAVGFLQCADEAVRRGRDEDQVDMVGHQAPGPDLDAGGGRGAGEEVAVEPVVRLAEEDRLPAVALLRDMMPQPCCAPSFLGHSPEGSGGD